MGIRTVKLSNSITFDEEKEKDIIECIDKLKQQHNFGTFVAHLIRIAFESPEAYGSKREIKKLIVKMTELGISPTRDAFFSQVSKDVAEMKAKVDAIYEMAYSDYILAQMGKRIGLEGKSENTLRTAFILERQLTNLSRSLGVEDISDTYSSNKVKNIEDEAKKVLEHIINSYDGIITELKQSVVANTIVNTVEQPVPVSTQPAQEKVIKPVQPEKPSYASDDAIVDLGSETSAKNNNKISVPTGDRAKMLARLMKSSGGEQ